MKIQISQRLAILLLLGLASEQEYSQAIELQQGSTQALSASTASGATVKAESTTKSADFQAHKSDSNSELDKVARPTSLAIDQLISVREDNLDSAGDDSTLPSVKEQSNTSPAISSVVKKYQKSQNKASKQQSEDKTGSKGHESADSGTKASTQTISETKSGNASGSEASEQVDVTEESKLADQIRNQAKAIADEQLKQQEKDKASGKLKISSAAAALNNAEMGIETNVDDSEASKKEILSISSDQLYVTDKTEAAKKSEGEPEVSQQPVQTLTEAASESAAITMAKKAAINAISSQPSDNKQTKQKDTKNTSSSNVELEASTDLENAQKIDEIEKNSQEMEDAGLSRQNMMIEDKTQVIEEDPTTDNKKDDLAVPNWPKYQDPIAQRAEIDKEVKQVKKQTEEYKKSGEDADGQLKKINKNTSTDFEQKQKEIDLQHKSTVSKIKAEIWGDRLQFLQKMIKLAEEGQPQQEALVQETPSPNDKPTIKVQALAQSVKKDKKQEKNAKKTKKVEKSDTKSGAQLSQQKKDKKNKEDLIHRIDKQLARLKSKNKEKAGATEKSTEGSKDVFDGIEDDDTDLDSKDYSRAADAAMDKLDKSIKYGSNGRYSDTDIDEYAVNNRHINKKLDRFAPHQDLDLYDLFKDFDRDGDGIVDDIDLDDPHWVGKSRNSGWKLDDCDDSYFRAGRYRGLTEEEWSRKQEQHQRNLEQLERKQKELEEAHQEVHNAIQTLTNEKDSIDKDIRQKLQETERLRVEFRKKAAERAAAERKAALERQRAIMEIREEERKRKAEQIRDTEKIEAKAIELHTKAKELQRQKLLVKDARQEVAEEIRKLKANIKFAMRAKEAAEKIKVKINERREWQKKHREQAIEWRKKQREAALKEAEEERQRREKLQESCPQTKVRSYACNSDGLRLVKVIRFVYDFDQERCLPKIEKKTMSCRSNIPRDLDGDGYDDVTGMPTSDEYSRWKYDPSHFSRSGYDDGAGYDTYGLDPSIYDGPDGYIRADDFHAQKQEKVQPKKSQAQKANLDTQNSPENEQGDNLTAEEEQELKQMTGESPEGLDSMSRDINPSPPQKLNRIKKPKSMQKPKRAPIKSEITEPSLEEDAASMSADSVDKFDYEAIQNKAKKAQSLAAQKRAIMKKKLIKQAVKEQSLEVSQHSDQQTPQENNIQEKSKEQIDQLSQHMGAIENKVQEITKKYEELKQSDQEKDKTIKKLSENRVQTSAPTSDVKKKEAESTSNPAGGPDKSRIQKFAKMLKTLNSYKTQYKKAKTQSERDKIHSDVESFTKKWLDTKNLLLQSEIEYKTPSDTTLTATDSATDVVTDAATVDPVAEQIQEQRTDFNIDVQVRGDR